MFALFPRLRGFNFRSRRGAEEAEAAEMTLSLSEFSAISALSPSLREPLSTDCLILNQVQYDDRSKGVHL